MPTPAEPNDSQLMLAYAGGSADAFELLYERHHGGLFRFVRRVLGAEMSAEAEEVAQDTWMKIVAARDRFEQTQASFKTWAYAIAQNTAIDRLRKGGREVSVDSQAISEESLSAAQLAYANAASISAEDTAFWRAAGQQLALCLEELPPAQRAAFLLYHEEGLAVLDVAAQLGEGFEAIKSRLRYAMGKLKKCLGAYLEPVLGAGALT